MWYINRIIWLIKQLFPLDYYSEYIEHIKENKIKKVSTWKMWFGRCYNIKTYEVK